MFADHFTVVVDCDCGAAAASAQIHHDISVPKHSATDSILAENGLAADLASVVDTEWLRLTAGEQDQFAIGKFEALALVGQRTDSHSDELTVLIDAEAFGAGESRGKADLASPPFFVQSAA